MNIPHKLFLRKLFQDELILFFGGMMLILLMLSPGTFSHINSFIHWPTLVSLSGLLTITTGIQQSGLVEQLATRLIRSVRTCRGLWLFLVFFSALMSMVLTNDIALFLIIPFTLQLNTRISLNIRPLLILEIIAVNTGSLITPIGNPQNIYLWQKSGLSFFSFIVNMLPVGIMLLGLLLTSTFFISNKAPLDTPLYEQKNSIDYKPAAIFVFMLVSYLLADNLGYGIYAVGLIFIVFFFFYHKTFLSVDWNLIILFLLMFIDVGIISQFSFLNKFTSSLDLNNPVNIITLGAGYSQLISNVPTTLFLSHYTDQWKYLAWGVNIGGNGVLIASFANLIAIRLAKKQKIAWLYHMYSIPFLLLSILLIYVWLTFSVI